MALICSSFLAQYRASSSGISENMPDKNKPSGDIPKLLNRFQYCNSIIQAWYDCVDKNMQTFPKAGKAIYRSENWGVGCKVLTTGSLMGSYT